MVHVVIAGAGFTGVNAAKELARDKRIQTTLVDRTNHHLFQPLLYQVAMAELSPADIAAPIRAIFRRCANVDVLQAEVQTLHLDERRITTDVVKLDYDYLIVATGSQHAYFGHDKWEAHAPGLKTLEQATEIRRRVLGAFEAADRTNDAQERRRLLTFVVVGGGPTGVELAGAIGEMSQSSLRGDFRHIDPRQTRIHLVEAGSRILSDYPPKLTERASRDLRKLGVDVQVDQAVSEVTAKGVQIGDAFTPAGTVLWAAGVTPSSLGKQFETPRDDQGRVKVGEDLSLPGKAEVFVAGDLAHCEQDGEPLPGVAGVALQQGRYLGRLIRRELGGRPREPFRYKDKGQMAAIGHNRAIARIGRLTLSGYPAWLTWVFVHIYYLTSFRNRIFVLLQWAWLYLTHRRGARLILGKEWRFYGD